MPEVQTGERQSVVVDKLVELFYAAAKSAAQRVQSLGWAQRMPTEKWFARRDDPNSSAYTLGRESVMQNSIEADGSLIQQAAPLLDTSIAAQAHACAVAIAALPGVNIPFYSPGRGDWSRLIDVSLVLTSDVDDPGKNPDWVLRHLIFPALDAHLRALSSLTTTTPGKARAFASEVVSVAMSQTLAYTVAIPLCGINLKSRTRKLSSRVALLRSVSAGEAGEHVNSQSNVRFFGGYAPCPSVVLEITILTSRLTHNPDYREQVDKWLCAFGLNDYVVAGSVASCMSRPRWTWGATIRNRLSLPSHADNWKSINGRQFKEIASTVDRLDRYSLVEPRSPQDLALHRYLSGTARPTHADAVLDYAIALEALLLPYDRNARHSDLSYRFRVHGAYYLSTDPSGRKRTAEQLRELYDLRSRLVHGGKYPDAVTIERARTQACELLRRGLSRAIITDFPAATDFTNLLLGST